MPTANTRKTEAAVANVDARHTEALLKTGAVQKAGIDRGLPFVQKPFTAEELVRQVRRALERSCPEEPGSAE